ncbi:hypothetical protein HRbin06_00671 [archaeon HR06]|nr:hypothetical protein HRbin06_00671 [archaeon HR06]
MGFLFGLILWFIIFIPVINFGFAPIMMDMMGPSAVNMLPLVLGLGLIEHILFGLLVATIIFLAK